MQKYWLKCEVTRGMLEGERAIVFAAADGQKVSLFAGDDKVNTVGPDTYVAVDLIDDNATHGLVRLPSGSLEGTSVVKVSKSLLLEKT